MCVRVHYHKRISRDDITRRANENYSPSRRLFWNLRGSQIGETDFIPFEPGACLLASIKFPPWRITVSFPVGLSLLLHSGDATRSRTDGRTDLSPKKRMKMEISAAQFDCIGAVCIHRLLSSLSLVSPSFSSLLLSLLSVTGESLFHNPGDTELPPIYFLETGGGGGSNLPCTTKVGTTREESGSLFAGNDTGHPSSSPLPFSGLRPTYIRSPFLPCGAVRTMQIYPSSLPLEMAQ